MIIVLALHGCIVYALMRTQSTDVPKQFNRAQPVWITIVEEQTVAEAPSSKPVTDPKPKLLQAKTPKPVVKPKPVDQLIAPTKQQQILASSHGSQTHQIQDEKPLPVLKLTTQELPSQESIQNVTSADRAPSDAKETSVSSPLPKTAQLAAAPAQVTEPRADADYLNNPSPVYPVLSRRLGEEGKVVLRVYVEASGEPGKAEIHSSSGYKRLDQSALSAVQKWKFVPAHQGEKAIGAFVLVPVIFNLKV